MEDSALPHQHVQVKTFHAVPVFGSSGGNGVAVAPDILGEGPQWDHRSERLTWVDILGRCLSIYDVRSNSVTRIGLKHDMAAFAVPTTKKNLLLCGSQLGIFTLALDSARITRMSHPERMLPRNRFNDGKVDPAGRLFTGTMQMKDSKRDTRAKGTGRLYCVNGGQHTPPTMVQAVGKITLSNGIGWSPEGDKFYFIDTATRQIQRWEYDIKSGTMEGRRVVYEMPEGKGRPVGLAVDSMGFIWVGAFEAGEVRRIDPDYGVVVSIIKVPTPLVTSCCFGGPYLSTLFITTAQATKAEEAANCTDKNAGLLYAVDVGVSGLPNTPFRLDESKL